MRTIDSVVPVTAVCGALLCFALPSAGRLASSGGAAAAATPIPGHGREALGVAAASAERSSGALTVRMPGRVALDEGRVYRVNAGVSGVIREVPGVVTGSRVRRNQILGSFAAPDAIPTVQLLILHGRGFDPDAGQPSPAWEVDAARRRSSLFQANIQKRTMELENMGIPAVQHAEIARNGRIPDAFRIVSPADGVVLERNVSPGLTFDRGYELYRIADLRKLWIVADVFPQDARYVRPGLRAEVSVPELEVNLTATIERILPEVDPAARTTKVRLEVENAGGLLLPGMFVDVRVDVDLPPAVVVPAGSVVTSGLGEAVYVQSAGGVPQLRAVRTGWRSGDRVQIVEGVAPGEAVFTAGSFLLDSESRMRSPKAAMVAVVPDGT